MKSRLARPNGGVVVAVIVALALGAGAAWAGFTLLRPADDPLEALSFTYVAATEGAVGSEISLNTVAEWKPVPVGDNRAQGVVTSIAVTAGDEVRQGTTLYSVDLRPVVVAQGDVPAFRPIGEKTTGPDVAQLQQLLLDLGLYGGSIDGESGAETLAAIKEWQQSLGLEPTGEVKAGDVIFVPTLPTRVALDSEKVFRGATLTGGEPVLRGLPSSPVFTLPVTDSQAALIPSGTRVEITSPAGDVWEGYATDQTQDTESQTVVVGLTGVDGVPICGDTCGQIAATGQSRLTSRIVTTEEVTGLVVPSAALVTFADGQVAVTTDEGERVSVKVVASARGMSVVEGLEPGTQVQIPASETGTSG